MVLGGGGRSQGGGQSGCQEAGPGHNGVWELGWVGAGIQAPRLTFPAGSHWIRLVPHLRASLGAPGPPCRSLAALSSLDAPKRSRPPRTPGNSLPVVLSPN